MNDNTVRRLVTYILVLLPISWLISSSCLVIYIATHGDLSYSNGYVFDPVDCDWVAGAYPEGWWCPKCDTMNFDTTVIYAERTLCVCRECDTEVLVFSIPE